MSKKEIEKLKRQCRAEVKAEAGYFPKETQTLMTYALLDRRIKNLAYRCY